MKEQKQSFSGLYEASVDGKGRFSFPSRLMAQLVGERIVYITLGIDGNCLWLVPQKYWEQLTSRLKSNSSPFAEEGRAVMRYFVGHAFEQEIEEKTRRIAVPSALSKMVGITDKCTIVGMINFFELWSPVAFQKQMEQDAPIRKQRTSELGGLVTF